MRSIFCFAENPPTGWPAGGGENHYISFRNMASKSARVAGRGLPGAQASAAAYSHRKGRSSSFSFSSLVGMPTSTEDWDKAYATARTSEAVKVILVP